MQCIIMENTLIKSTLHDELLHYKENPASYWMTQLK